MKPAWLGMCEDFKARFERSGFIMQHNFAKEQLEMTRRKSGAYLPDALFAGFAECVERLGGRKDIVSVDSVYENPCADINRRPPTLSMAVRYDPSAFSFRVADMFPFDMRNTRPGERSCLIVEALFAPAEQPGLRYSVLEPFSADGFICRRHAGGSFNEFMLGQVDFARRSASAVCWWSDNYDPAEQNTKSMGVTDSVESLHRMVTHGILVEERKKAKEAGSG